MDKIYFTRDIGRLLETQFPKDFWTGTVVVHHAMYDKPEVDAAYVLEWQRYKAIHAELKPERIVTIGLNRMKTPSNRCDFIHAYMAVMTPQIPKISIDTAPFIGEPWRLYYHYQLVGSFDRFGANYSYPIEGEWARWFLRDSEECQFRSEVLRDRIVDTWTDLPRLDTRFELYPPDPEDVEWYEEAKSFELGRYRASKSFLTGLTKAANKHFRMKIGYDSYLTGGLLRVPDVGIYRFMVEENRRRQAIYNLFTI